MTRMITELDPDVYLERDYVVLDFETTRLPGAALNDRNDVVLACWWRVTGGRIERKAQWGSIYQQAQLVADIERSAFIVVQSAQFELKWLRKVLDLHNLRVYDTLLGQWVLHGNQRKPRDLESICRELHVPLVKDPFINTLMKGGVCPSDMPRPWLYDRCMLDVQMTYRVFHEQLALLQDKGLLHIAYQRNMVAITLADIAFNGMALDREVVYTMYADEMRRYRESLDSLGEMAEINWNSHNQKRDFIYNELGFPVPLDWKGDPILTKGGKYTTETEKILEFTASTPDQAAFLDVWHEYAQSNGRLTKNLQFFKGVVDEYGRIFHANIKQGTARSHRLASSGMPLHISEFDKEKRAQIQNIDNFLKGAICARHPDWSIGDTDAAGMEFRIGVELTRDLQGYQDIIAGHDVHSFTASELLGIQQDRITKDQRRHAKRDTFKPLYYGRSGSPQQRRYYAAFRARYPDIDTAQEAWIAEVLETRELVLPYGMRYYWPDVEIYPPRRQGAKGFVKHSNKICNYPIQGFATAEIVPLGVVKLWADMREHNLESFLINTVHDSAMAEVHPDEHDEFTELSQRAFTDEIYPILHQLYDYEFATPLGAETQIGKHWSEGDEIKYESKTPFKFRPREWAHAA